MKKLIASLALCCAAAGPLAAQDQVAYNGRIDLAGKYLGDTQAEEDAFFAPQRYRRSRNTPVGYNVFSGSPVNLVVVNGYGCYAFGFSYERLLGPDQILGVQIPVYFAFGVDNILDGDEGQFFYTTPGLQVHVAGARRRFDYAVGPSLLLGNLYERDYRNNAPDLEYNTFTSGILVDNNLNFQRKHFLFGIHIAMGSTFPNDQYHSQFFFQFGLRFGGRF
jgi:hypothetical protein